MEHPRLEIDVVRHTYKICLSFLADLYYFGLKVSKKANILQRKLFLQKIDTVIIKCKGQKGQKNLPKIDKRSKTFAQSYNSKKLPFSVTFSLITFIA